MDGVGDVVDHWKSELCERVLCYQRLASKGIARCALAFSLFWFIR